MCEHLSTGMEMNTSLHMPGPVSRDHGFDMPAPRIRPHARPRGPPRAEARGGRAGAEWALQRGQTYPSLCRASSAAAMYAGIGGGGGGGGAGGGGCACKVPSGPMTPLGPAPGPACTSRRSRSSLPPLSLMKAAAAACIPPRPSPLPTHGRLWGHTQRPRPAAKKSHPLLRTSSASLVPARPGPARPIIFDCSCT